MPKKIVIATSVNNLMEFGRKVSFESKNLKSSTNNFFNLKFIEVISKFLKRNLNNLRIGSFLSNYEHSLIEGCCFGIAKINSKLTGKEILDWKEKNNQIKYLNFSNEMMNKLYQIVKKHKYNPNNIIITIEPDSFLINYEKIYPKAWKKYDTRQTLHKFNGAKMSLVESGEIMSEYNYIYIKSAQKYQFSIFRPDPYSFPKYSFYS